MLQRAKQTLHQMQREDPHLAGAVRTEILLLRIRYGLIPVIFWVGLRGPWHGHYTAALMVILLFVTHNVVVHTVLWFGRHDFFHRRRNFALHFLMITTLAALTFPDVPPAALLVLFLMGYAVYAPKAEHTFAVFFLSVGGLLLAVLLSYLAFAETADWLELFLQFLLVAIGGRMATLMADTLRRLKARAGQRAEDADIAEDLLKALLESLPEALLLYDERGVITHANARAHAFLEAEPGTLRGRRFSRFFTEPSKVDTPIPQKRQNATKNAKARLLTEQGERKDCVLQLQSLNLSKGFFHAVTLLALPETSDEHEKYCTRIQAKGTCRYYEDTKVMCQAYSESLCQQLRSPLTASLGFSEMLLDESAGDLNGPQRQMAQSTRRGLERAMELVNAPRPDALFAEERPKHR
jgi:PAS domain-containing protein